MRIYLITLVFGILTFSCQKKENKIVSKDEVIAEVIKAKLTAKNDISQNIRAISESNNQNFDEIDFKSDLGQYFGSRGLNQIANPNLKEFSEQIQGIWKLDNRFISGKEVKSDEWIINKLVKPGNYEAIESLTLNKESNDTKSNGLLASYGVITLKIIQGTERRLPKGTSGILQVFDYTLLGENFDGFNGKHKGLAEFVWVKQNGEYRAVIGSIKITDLDGNIIMDDDSNCMVLNAMPNSYTIQYPNIKGFDSFTKVKGKTDFLINEAWDKMNSDTDFINPTEWKDYLN